MSNSESSYVAARLAAIVDSSDDAIVGKDLNGIIRSWNRAAERMFGYTADEAIGQSITIIIPPDRTSEEATVLGRIRQGERVDHFQTVRRRKDGRLLDISITVSPIRDEHGRIVGASKIARDITAEKRAREDLEAETRIVETLNAVGRRVASTMDPEKVIRTIVDAATDVTYAEVGTFIDKDSAATILRTLGDDEVIRVGDATRDAAGPTCPFVSEAGKPPIRAWLGLKVTSAQGHVLGVLALGHTRAGAFTARHERLVSGIASWASVAMDNARLYRDAQEANSAKDQFLATLSHELRTPLNAIMGWAQILRTSKEDSWRLRAADTIHRNARAQAQLIEDLLDVSRIVSGKLAISREDVDLVAVVAAAVEDVRPAASEKHVTISLSMGEGVATVLGDPSRLQQIVWNLLSNAVKFTPTLGRIDVTVRMSDTHADVIVADTGIGISPEFIGHVFDRFRQQHASGHKRFSGLGIGLEIVKHLAEAHGGTVRAESEGEGKGARFTVRLPLSMMSAPLPRAQSDHLRDVAVNLDGVRVLVVDDEPDSAEMLAAALSEFGASVTTAASALEAVTATREQPFDVILADIGMPDIDGYDLMRIIRRTERGRDHRVTAFAVTAFAGGRERDKAIESGFDGHFGKPINLDQLVAAIAGAMAPPR